MYMYVQLYYFPGHIMYMYMYADVIKTQYLIKLLAQGVSGCPVDVRSSVGENDEICTN